MTSRALVLGGGGPVGIAWEAGLIAGAAAKGIALADADCLLGTSAGSAVGAELALGRAPADLYDRQLAQSHRSGGRDVHAGASDGAPDLGPLLELMSRRPETSEPLAAWLRELGAYALAARTLDEASFVRSFGRLAEADWPAGGYACTAVDAYSGEFRLWDARAGVPLGRAVASSCAVPGIFPPITIEGARYMDGGMRSPTNADLARGYDEVIVVAVTGPMATQAVRRRLEAEIATLREDGARVTLLTPDEPSIAAFGPNLMDAARRRPAAEAGFAQGRAEAARLRAHRPSAR